MCLIDFFFHFLTKVVIGGDNGLIQVYDENFGLLHSFQAHESYIYIIEYLPNGYVATCSDDTSTKVWLPSKTNWTLIQTYKNHIHWVNALEYINEDALATGYHDRTIKIWSICTGLTNTIISTGSNVYSLQLLSNGFHLAAGMVGKIKIYDIFTGLQFGSQLNEIGNVLNLELISKDLLASTSQDKSVRIWNLTTYSEKFNLIGHKNSVFGLKLISSGVLASASYDSNIILWNLTTGSFIRSLMGHQSNVVYSIDLLSDGQTLVSGSMDNTIKVWNTDTGQRLKTSGTLQGIQSIYSLVVINSSMVLGKTFYYLLFSIFSLFKKLPFTFK